MNSKLLLKLILLILLVGTAAMAYEAFRIEPTYTVDSADFLQPEDFKAASPKSTEGLTSEEKADLIYMREEEKLARDVYLFLGERWTIPIFSNIAASEQTHTDAVKNVLTNYQIADPVRTDKLGEFNDPRLKALYDELTTRGSQSKADALQVGATIEDLDIADLQKALIRTSRTDIESLYANLMKGSRNHLRAFNKQLVRSTGNNYEAQFLTSEEISTIIHAPQERGFIR